MRFIIFILLLLIVCAALYFLIPTDGVRLRAKGVIQEVQSVNPPPELTDITSQFGDLFSGQSDDADDSDV